MTKESRTPQAQLHDYENQDKNFARPQSDRSPLAKMNTAVEGGFKQNLHIEQRQEYDKQSVKSLNVNFRPLT